MLSMQEIVDRYTTDTEWGNHRMKTYTLVGGVDGVGKSSFLGILKECCTDLGLNAETDSKIRDCLSRGVSFTQETTLSGRKTENTAKEAKEQGYYIRLFYVALDSAEESVERIQNRVRHGGHDIPGDDVLRRFAGRWEAVTKVLPYCDEAEFYDNGNGFVKVAEYRNGEIRPVGNLRPAWLTELMKNQA